MTARRREVRLAEEAEAEQALNVELALLAALLDGGSAAIAQAAEELQPRDFADRRAGIIYEAILALDSQGRPVELVTVAETLKSLGRLAEVGGPLFLATLPSRAAFSTVGEYVRLIREKAARRDVSALGQAILELSGQETLEVPALLDAVGRQVSNVLFQREPSRAKPMSEAIGDMLALLDAMRRDGGLLGLGTGLADVDAVLAGMQPGELVVLAARPGVGKTALAMQVALHQALEHQRHVGVFSLEMPTAQLSMRMTAGQARVPLEKLRRGRLSPVEEERISEAAQRLYEAPITIDDSADVSPMELRTRARRLKQQHPTLALLVIDYLQLLRPRGRFESRQAEVAEVSRSLKMLAKELELPVLALSQLNRKVEERKGPPQLSDLRESGAIEQDADVVVFLHRAAGDEEEASTEAVPIEVHVAKQRNGPLGTAELVFMAPYTRFEGRSYRGP